MERMGTEADELRQEIIANTPAEPESIDDDADFGFGFSSSGAEEGTEYSGDSGGWIGGGWGGGGDGGGFG